MTELLRQTWAVFRKELLVEWRQRSRISGVFFFALAIVLMVAFASPGETVLRRIAGGTLWIGLLLASTRAFDQSYTVEQQNGCLEGMLLWPVAGEAIFYGKALANTIILVGVAVGLLPLLIAVFDSPIQGNPALIFGYIVLGSAALAAPGTLYGLIATQARGSSVLLPLLMFPLVVPAVLAASRGTTVVMEGDPMQQGQAWLGLLVAFDAVHWSLSGLFYTRIVEDA